LGGRATFTIDIGPYVRECLATVRENLGEGFDHLCDIKTVDVYSYPVLGWIVTTSPSSTFDGSRVVSVKPIVLWLGDVQQRQARMDVDLGYSLGPSGELDTLNPHNELDEDEKVAGVLPSWPGTYYVVGYVDDIAFILGVHVNPDGDQLVKRLLKAYLDWLKEPETRELKDKLAKPKPENQA
jgi:hypothetical protein